MSLKYFNSSYCYLLKGKTDSDTAKTWNSTKKQLWKLTGVYSSWKVKDVVHDFTFFLDFAWWVGELLQSFIILKTFCKYRQKAVFKASKCCQRETGFSATRYR